MSIAYIGLLVAFIVMTGLYISQTRRTERYFNKWQDCEKRRR